MNRTSFANHFKKYFCLDPPKKSFDQITTKQLKNISIFAANRKFLINLYHLIFWPLVKNKVHKKSLSRPFYILAMIWGENFSLELNASIFCLDKFTPMPKHKIHGVKMAIFRIWSHIYQKGSPNGNGNFYKKKSKSKLHIFGVILLNNLS